MGRIRRVVTEALSDAVPFETLLADLGVPRDPRNNPLFQTALLFQPPPISPADDWSLQLMESDVRDAVGSAKFDIRIELDERPEGHVAGGLVFSTDLFDRATAREMASHWAPRCSKLSQRRPKRRWPNMIWSPRRSDSVS